MPHRDGERFVLRPVKSRVETLTWVVWITTVPAALGRRDIAAIARIHVVCAQVQQRLSDCLPEDKALAVSVEATQLGVEESGLGAIEPR